MVVVIIVVDSNVGGVGVGGVHVGVGGVVCRCVLLSLSSLIPMLVVLVSMVFMLVLGVLLVVVLLFYYC